MQKVINMQKMNSAVTAMISQLGLESLPATAPGELVLLLGVDLMFSGCELESLSWLMSVVCSWVGMTGVGVVVMGGVVRMVVVVVVVMGGVVRMMMVVVVGVGGAVIKVLVVSRSSSEAGADVTTSVSGIEVGGSEMDGDDDGV